MSHVFFEVAHVALMLFAIAFFFLSRSGKSYSNSASYLAVITSLFSMIAGVLGDHGAGIVSYVVDPCFVSAFVVCALSVKRFVAARLFARSAKGSWKTRR